jgi:RNA polymerase sigma factor (sigma-70 family)
MPYLGYPPITTRPEDYPTEELYELLRDEHITRHLYTCAKQVEHSADLPYRLAHGYVMSAIGDPPVVEALHRARSNGRFGLARLIIRRRVLDLLRRDGRRAHHLSLHDSDADAESVVAEDATPDVQVEQREIVSNVRSALASFAQQGPMQHRQAQLLRRSVLDEASARELSAELGCNEKALRVRLHSAKAALLRHVQTCRPELEYLATAPEK